MSDASKLNKAMEFLREHGAYAERRVACCQSCSWGEFEMKGVTEHDTVLFTHTQTEEGAWKRGGKLKRDMWLYWSGDKDLIAFALAYAGLEIEVPETTSTAFKVVAHG